MKPSRIMGVNTRSYATRDSWTRGEVTVVLVAGSVGDYAAYAGMGEPEWVAAHGDKLSFEEACCHFPGGQLDAERYRP